MESRLSLAVSLVLALAASGVGCAAGSADDSGPSQKEDSSVGGDDTSAGDSGGDDSSSSDAPGDAKTDTKPGDGGADSKADTSPGGDTGTTGDTGTGGDSGGGDTAETCPTPCSLDVKICDGDAVRTCISSGGCNVYSAPVPCSGGTVCSGGACVTTCSDVCTLGDKQCAGGGVQTCETKPSGCTDWSSAITCPSPTVCSGGACVLSCSDACSSGAKRCAAGSTDAYQTCELQSSGCYDWSTAVACTGGSTCSGAGTCVPCTTGAKRCGATGNVETCTSGTWLETTACSFGCATGACVTTVACTPGTYRCSGTGVEVCNSSGTAYLYSSTCAVSCSGGLCTGACTAGAKRCNGSNVETCNGAGTAWDVSDTCTTFCDSGTAKCALSVLTIDPTTTGSFDGEIVVADAVVVKAGSTLTSTTGNLTLRAKSITVELGGSITAAPTGAATTGSTGYSACTSAPGGGGAGASIGIGTDSQVSLGGAGGTGGQCTCCSGNVGGAGGKGGGVIRLIANTINIAGVVTANGSNGSPGTAGSGYAGGGGGGGGGGILVAADDLTISGAVSASGGSGGPGAGGSAGSGATGSSGRVKILYGSKNAITGTITGTKTQSLLPPLTITSNTHPDPSLFYNDDFATLALTWNRAFPSVDEYYQLLDTTSSNVPTPATAIPIATELVSYTRTKLVAGSNYFHIAPFSASGAVVGSVETVFRIQVNTTPPTTSSTSHPSSTTWSTNNNPYYQWTVPNGDANYKGFFYVLDHYGDTVPKASDTFLPITQKALLVTGLVDGVWDFHVVSVDTKGYLTKLGGHYRVRIGADPGNGSVLGKVIDSSSASVSGAKVTINHGLFNFAGEAPDQTTSATGDYSFPANIPAGTWEVTVTKGTSTLTQTVTVTKGVSTTSNFTLP